MKKLLFNTEYKQKVSEVSLPYEGSADSPLNIELSCLRICVFRCVLLPENLHTYFELSAQAWTLYKAT
jgi:hypothetical protein